MIRLKTFDEMLEVILTSEEKNERAAKMSATVLERRRLKEEAKRQNESFNSKIKLLDQEIEAEAVVIENGLEWRKVQCAERISETGIEVHVVRTDTGEVVRVRAMSEEERQEELFPDSQLEEQKAADEEVRAQEERSEEAIEADAVQDPCVCGHQTSCSHYVTGEGTPIETELPSEEIQRIAKTSNASLMSEIDKGTPLKIVHINEGPYLVLGGMTSGQDRKWEAVWACPVLPLTTVGEGNARTYADAYQEYEASGFKTTISYLNVKFNGGSKKNPDWWVIVGDQIVFTADRCDECGRIEGAHAPQCVKASKFTYNTYLEFAKAQKLKNPASPARKMELSCDRDDEVRVWLESQQGAPADGALFNAKPEPKPKRRGKLQLHSDNSYAEGL